MDEWGVFRSYFSGFWRVGAGADGCLCSGSKQPEADQNPIIIVDPKQADAQIKASAFYLVENFSPIRDHN